MLVQKVAKYIKQYTSDQDDVRSRYDKLSPAKEKELRACLAILLHCLIILGPAFQEKLFAQLTLKELYSFVLQQPLDAEYSRLLMNGPSINGTFSASKIYRYSIDIVWLTLSIFTEIYSKRIQHTTLRSKVSSLYPSKEPLMTNEKHFEVLKSNVNYFNESIYTSSSITEDVSSQNLRGLDSELMVQQFELYLKQLKLCLCSDELPLIELGLNALGQLCALSNDKTLEYMLFNQTLDMKTIMARLIMCQSSIPLILVGKVIFTICLRNIAYLEGFIRLSIPQSSFVDEVLFLAFEYASEELSARVQIQFKNILFLLIQQYEPFALSIIDPLTPPKDCLLRLQHQLAHSNAFIQFSSLQLIYGFSCHESCHEILMGFRTYTQNELLSVLKKTTIQGSNPYIRYYSLLIWKNLMNSSKESLTHFLCLSEKCLNLFVLLLQDESHLTLKRVSLSILRDIIIRKQNDQEWFLLYHHFNILFECTELFRHHLSLVTREFNLKSISLKTLSSPIRYDLLLLEDLYFFLVSFIRSYQQHFSSSKENEAQTHPLLRLFDQYNFENYMGSYLSLIGKICQVQPNMNAVYTSLKSSWKIIKDSYSDLIKQASKTIEEQQPVSK